MKGFQGATLSWELSDGCIELTLHREPCNEIGTKTIEELEKFVEAHETLKNEAHALIIYSSMKPGFCAAPICASCTFARKRWGSTRPPRWSAISSTALIGWRRRLTPRRSPPLRRFMA